MHGAIIKKKNVLMVLHLQLYKYTTVCQKMENIRVPKSAYRYKPREERNLWRPLKKEQKV